MSIVQNDVVKNVLKIGNNGILIFLCKIYNNRLALPHDVIVVAIASPHSFHIGTKNKFKTILLTNAMHATFVGILDSSIA